MPKVTARKGSTVIQAQAVWLLQGFRVLQGPAQGHHVVDTREMCLLANSSFLMK